MKDSRSESTAEDEGEDLSKLYRHKIPLSLKFFVKDIEISKRDFILLFLILNSLLFLLIGQIGLDLMLLNINRNSTDYYSWASLFNGILLGLVISIFLSDQIRKPIILIKNILILSLFITFIQIVFIFLKLYLILNLLTFVNAFFITLALIVNGKLFLYKTTILERARVWSYLFIFSFLIIAIIFSTLYFNFIIIIPITFIILSVWVLNKNKEEYEIFPQKVKKSKRTYYNLDLIKYYLFFAFLSLTTGLATPTERSLDLLIQTLGGNIALIFVIIIIFSIIASLLIGIIFDYFGRIGALSYIILALALATYIHSFQFESVDLPLVVIYTTYLAVIMCVPLLVGDSTTRDKYGKTISFSYLIIGIGILIGLYLRISIPFIILNVFLAENVINGTILMLCIVCFIFLINMRESLPKIEQEWSNYLIHMFIIHESGILLYDHSFITEQENLSADLKAGGIIGVKNILKEIIRGEKEVRTIDHGDRKLMLKLNASGRVVFALVVKEELTVLRKKLELLIENFDKSYGEFTGDISLTGIDMRIFKPIKYLARKYFGR